MFCFSFIYMQLMLCDARSQSYQTLISSFFRYSLLSLAILKYRTMLQTLKLNNKKRKKSLFYVEKSLVRLAPGFELTTLDSHPFMGIRDVPNYVLGQNLRKCLKIWWNNMFWNLFRMQKKQKSLSEKRIVRKE